MSDPHRPQNPKGPLRLYRCPYQRPRPPATDAIGASLARSLAALLALARSERIAKAHKLRGCADIADANREVAPLLRAEIVDGLRAVAEELER